MPKEDDEESQAPDQPDSASSDAAGQAADDRPAGTVSSALPAGEDGSVEEEIEIAGEWTVAGKRQRRYAQNLQSLEALGPLSSLVSPAHPPQSSQAKGGGRKGALFAQSAPAASPRKPD